MDSSQYFHPIVHPNSRRGFSLVEILVVVVIIVILVGIGVPVMLNVRSRQKVKAVMAEVELIETAIDNFKIDVGDVPNLGLLEEKLGRSLTSAEKASNLGNEIMIACLFTVVPSKEKKDPWIPLALTGTDGSKLIDSDNDGLKELPDAWNKPYIYFNNTDYHSSVSHDYSIGVNLDNKVDAHAQFNSDGVYYRLTDYQLWSCCPNMANDTNSSVAGDDKQDDDIRNFSLK